MCGEGRVKIGLIRVIELKQMKGLRKMSTVQAMNNYTGKGGCQRMNCAQAVLSAFKRKFNVEDDTIDLFKIYGGGRAPDGVCGAYYAAKYIIDKYDKDKIDQLKQYFIEAAGALKCNNIRELRKLPCIGCVEKSSQFLEKLCCDEEIS